MSEWGTFLFINFFLRLKTLHFLVLPSLKIDYPCISPSKNFYLLVYVLIDTIRLASSFV